MEFRKMAMTILYVSSKRDTEVKKRFSDYMGEGEVGMI